MNNEEIKKKICKIIADNYLPKEMPDRLEDYKLYRFKRAADALIAAGLTFDDKWKHKAEVAEKKLEKWQNIYLLALKNAIKFYGTELCPIECPFQYNFCGSNDCINLLAENFMQQAEQELAEEQ